MKKTIVFDFDGVIHSYKSGWKGICIIPDEPVPGIAEVIRQLREDDYKVVVVSTRCKHWEGQLAIVKYLERHDIEVDDVCMEKPPAIVYIDDRAICFDGNVTGLIDKIKNFEPWTTKAKVEQVNHPIHYNAPGRKECIEEMVDEWGEQMTAVWCEMTAYKYTYRAGTKDDNPEEQDLAKRDWYLEKAKELRNRTQMKAPSSQEVVKDEVVQATAQNVGSSLNDVLKSSFEKGVEKQLRVGSN